MVSVFAGANLEGPNSQNEQEEIQIDPKITGNGDFYLICTLFVAIRPVMF